MLVVDVPRVTPFGSHSLGRRVALRPCIQCWVLALCCWVTRRCVCVCCQWWLLLLHCPCSSLTRMALETCG